MGGAPVFGELVGQERVVAQLAGGGGRGPAAARRAGPGHDARLAVHRAAGVGPVGGGARLRGRAAVRPTGAAGSARAATRCARAPIPTCCWSGRTGCPTGCRQTRDLVLRAAGAPVGGRWQVVVFEDADRATEQAANALLKAIEEPSPRTVWLLCAPVRGGARHDDPVPLPAGHAAHAADRRRWPRCSPAGTGSIRHGRWPPPARPRGTWAGPGGWPPTPRRRERRAEVLAPPGPDHQPGHGAERGRRRAGEGGGAGGGRGDRGAEHARARTRCARRSAKARPARAWPRRSGARPAP